VFSSIIGGRGGQGLAETSNRAPRCERDDDRPSTPAVVPASCERSRAEPSRSDGQSRAALCANSVLFHKHARFHNNSGVAVAV